MTATENLHPTQFQPITKNEARGDSPEVSPEAFQAHAVRGKDKLTDIRKSAVGQTGIHDNLGRIKNDAWKAIREPWGGVTVSGKSGRNISPSKGYAMSVRDPGTSTVSVPLDSSRENFDRHVEQVANERGHLGTHLGIFRDDDEGRIDIDPVTVLKSKKDVRDVGAYTRSIGGAYDYSTGNGVFPPHVNGR